MIRTIDAITINGSRQCWNGFIYDFNYQPSFGPNPSYAIVNFVSEDGAYSIVPDDLQLFTPHVINVGNNITLSMFPVNYKIDKKSSGKTLEVRYIDTSIVLDKKIVVLNGRQGNDGTANTPINNLENADGTNGSGTIYKNDKFINSCYIPVGKQLLTVEETPYQVLNVVYTFIDLMDAIANDGIIINSDSFPLIQNSNQYYFNSYIGTLRNVLTQWCTDLGYGFYWENNAIHFLDLTAPLILDTSSFDNAVQESNSEEVSIEDTVGRVACAFYGQDREVLGNFPGQNTEINFNCLTMSQVGFSPDQIDSIKAAFLGEDFFYSYHTLLNSPYGDNILGIVNKKITNNTNTSAKFDPNPSIPVFSNYIFAVQDPAVAKYNFDLYNEIAQYVGYYYYRGMSFGDYKLIVWDQPVKFFDELLECSLTTIGKFAGILGASNEQLKDFMLGLPYVADQTQGNDSTNTTDSSANKIYDVVLGDAILEAGGQSWQVYDDSSGIAQFVNISPPDIANYLLFNNFSTYYVNYISNIATEQVTLSNFLKAEPFPGASELYSTVQGLLATGPIQYQYRMYGYIPLPESQPNFDLNGFLKSPEEIYPDKLLHVYIKNENSIIQPKIEEFFRSETDKTGNTVDCHSNVIKNELNFRNITREDLTAIGNLGRGAFGFIFSIYGIQLDIPAIPNPENLEEVFKLFTQNLTLSKTDPTIVKTYSLPYIDLPDNYLPLIGKGLMNLQIKMDSNGINSTYTLGTRLMQVPSIEAVRMNLEFQRKTNQSRFLPYGYSFII